MTEATPFLVNTADGFLGKVRQLAVLQAEIRACRRCVSVGLLAEAGPITTGLATARIMIIGQAPSRTDHAVQMAYRGPAGRKLREWFYQAGFTPEAFAEQVYLAAITKCFPGRLPGKSTDRLPSRAEQALCRSWLDAEIALVQPKVFVLFGGLAIKTFLSPAPLTELIGQTFEKEGRIYLPLPHSSGASTWLNYPTNRALLMEAIARLQEVREELCTISPMAAIPVG